MQENSLGPVAAETVLRECLVAFGTVRLTVRGSCMVPAVRDGEVVQVQSTRGRRPGWGDLILARGALGLRLHRLVWVPPWPGRLRTKADRVACVDPWIRREDVLGTVTRVERPQGASPVRDRWRAWVSLLQAVRLRVGRAVARR